jgi:hypothetical protein
LNIWTVFFIVVSVVILTSPLLLSKDVVSRQGSDKGYSNDGKQDWEDSELDLDLASGRLAQEDYDVMTGQETRPAVEPTERAERDDGNFPEG